LNIKKVQSLETAYFITQRLISGKGFLNHAAAEISRTPIRNHLEVLHPISRRIFIDVITAADISCFSS
jgi:hypothetical protein